jgi:hypothetical protein
MTTRFNEAIWYSPREGHCYTRCAPSRGLSVGPGLARSLAQPAMLVGIRQFSLVKRATFREPRPTNS